jgi:hypothetical protein
MVPDAGCAVNTVGGRATRYRICVADSLKSGAQWFPIGFTATDSFRQGPSQVKKPETYVASANEMVVPPQHLKLWCWFQQLLTLPW